jgi:hypothetical protein
MASPSPSLFDNVVVATDLEPDDVMMLYGLCARAFAAGAGTPTISVVLGEGSPAVKRAVWAEVKVALGKVFPAVRFTAYDSGVRSAVDYDTEALDAAFNFPPGIFEDEEEGGVVDTHELWNSLLLQPTLVLFARPPREWVNVENLPVSRAPLYMYGGYNLRGGAGGALDALSEKFLGGVHVVERRAYLGSEFNPTEELPLVGVFGAKTAFAGVLRRLCGVWNPSMADFKIGKLVENFRDEKVFVAYVQSEDQLAFIRDADARGGLKDLELAIADHIVRSECLANPETAVLWADPLLVALVGSADEEWEPSYVFSEGSADKNPVFVRHPEGKLRVPRAWEKLNESEKAGRKAMLVEACREWFM